MINALLPRRARTDAGQCRAPVPVAPAASRARCISLASVGKVNRASRTAVSTVTRSRSFSRQRPHPVGHGQALWNTSAKPSGADPVPPPIIASAPFHAESTLRRRSTGSMGRRPALADLLIREIGLRMCRPTIDRVGTPGSTLLRIQGFIGLVEESPRDPAPQQPPTRGAG